MGKRSNFERMPRDLYSTPWEAVWPLLPHLAPRSSYVEPCVGEFALVQHLADYATCVACGDISTGKDALDWIEDDVKGADYIITNPPWDRKLLHPMISHFASLRPTWLLFDADWVHTRQAIPFLPMLCTIVSVGRVKWIPGTKMTGKDNSAWHLFDAKHNGLIEFFGRKP